MSIEYSRKIKREMIIAIILFFISALLSLLTFALINQKEQKIETERIIEVEKSVKLTLSENLEIGKITNEDGKTENIEVQTIEEIDSLVIEDTDLDRDALGEWYNISSPIAFKNSTYGKCIIAENKFGAQCVSLARVYWLELANRTFSTCGTGKAKGAWECKEQNAGNEFDIIEGNSDIEEGDWIIWNSGENGHVAMALGSIHNGYITVLGENQGGKACSEGGSATNIVNISIKGILGVFRPKIYHISVPDGSFV